MNQREKFMEGLPPDVSEEDREGWANSRFGVPVNAEPLKSVIKSLKKKYGADSASEFDRALQLKGIHYLRKERTLKDLIRNFNGSKIEIYHDNALKILFVRRIDPEMPTTAQ